MIALFEGGVKTEIAKLLLQPLTDSTGITRLGFH